MNDFDKQQSQNFDTCDELINELRRFCQNSLNLDDINEFILSDSFIKEVLSKIGIHAGIWAYFDVIKNKLFYLTEEHHKDQSDIRKNNAWPFLLNLEQLNTDFQPNNAFPKNPEALENEDEEYSEITYQLVQISRTFESENNNAPQALKTLGKLMSNDEPMPCDNNFSEFELNEKILYIPSGEMLFCILGWTIYSQETSENLIFPRDLTKKLILTKTLENSKTYKVLAFVLNEALKTNNRTLINSCPTIAFLSSTEISEFQRDFNWGQVLCDLGLAKHVNDKHINIFDKLENNGFKLTKTDRLQTIAWWLIEQHESSRFARPSVNNNLSRCEEAFLKEVIKNGCKNDTHAWKAITMIFSILYHTQVSGSDWESSYSFGMGTHQLWLRASTERSWRWVAPYDWCCMPVMPDLLPLNTKENVTSNTELPIGTIFLSLDARAHYPCELFDKNFQRIRAVTLIFALVENRLTYVEKIKNKANFLGHYKEATFLWLKQYKHEISPHFAELLVFFEKQEDSICNDALIILQDLFDSYIEQSINEDPICSLREYIEELDDWPTINVFTVKNIAFEFNFTDDFFIKPDLFLRMILVNILTNAYKSSLKNCKIIVDLPNINTSKEWQYTFFKNSISEKNFSSLNEMFVIETWYEYSFLKKPIRKGISIISEALFAQELPNAEFKISKEGKDYYFTLSIPIKMHITNDNV